MIRSAAAVFLGVSLLGFSAPEPPTRPNILWILGEDASAHIGCYGETAIRTPHLDRLARDGVRFENAFVTCPVCSPSRSAMITGMVQTTLGAHNHRSQNKSAKAGGNVAFYDSYVLPKGVKLIPQLFKEAGYFTTLGSVKRGKGLGKTDYNFIWDPEAYDGSDWKRCPKNKPFFAQIDLRGGKNRRARQHGTDPERVKLPPYYPDHPVLRRDWADYLNSWVQMDLEVGDVLEQLDEEGVADNTIVFFWTDHGVSHLRGKQFLYEEGIRVPFIVRFPDGRLKGTVREDLVIHIDIAATSLAMAGIPIPKNVQGLDLLADDYAPRNSVFSARDRCDESVDILRCVRTKRYKYIRNFLAHVPHAQPNQYKDGKTIVRTMRQLHSEGKLTPLQDRVFAARRPLEELYDLKEDPYETRNLAADPAHKETLDDLRRELTRWMCRTKDLGLVPEPVLEELGRKYGNKNLVFHHKDNSTLECRLRGILGAVGRKDRQYLTRKLESPFASLRYWAATGLGISGDASSRDALRPLLTDASGGVRVAAALALCRLGDGPEPVRLLAREIENENLIAGMFAIRALEQIGEKALPVRDAIEKAKKNRYEFTRRIARRLSSKLAAR